MEAPDPKPTEKPTVFLPHGGYRKLRSYKVAEAFYDATVAGSTCGTAA